MIYKYPLGLQDSQAIEMPKDALILSAQVQKMFSDSDILGTSTICVWALVDSNQKKTELRKFLIVGTGQPHPPATTMRFIDTVQMGGFVWHVFEEVDR